MRTGLRPVALCLVLLCVPGAALAGKPQHVMSLNMCTDALVLEMLPPERIASVTYYAEKFTQPALQAKLRHVAINYGNTEEVLRQKPDLVLAGYFSTPMARVILKKEGVNVAEIPSADNFDQIRAVTRQVAQLLGETAKGEDMIRQMDRQLADLAATKPKNVIRVAGWSGGGSVPGKGTLFDAILTAAGGTNIAATTGGERYGSFDIEELLKARPDMLAYGSSDGTQPSLRTDEIEHPLVMKLFRGRRITYPELYYSCGLPQVPAAIGALRASMLQVMSVPRQAP